MKKFLIWFALLASTVAALAQSSPGLVTGQVPTAAQWNSYFAAKQDVLGYTAVNRGGDTMSGRLATFASTPTRAGFSINPGTAPTTPVNGDVWTTSAGLYVQINGSTIGPLLGLGQGVTGPGTTTDRALTRWSGTVGGVVLNSGATLSDAGLLTTPTLAVTGASNFGTGGSGNVTYNDGTINYRIAVISGGQVYTGTFSNHQVNEQINNVVVGSWTSTGLNSVNIGSSAPGSGQFTTLSASTSASVSGTLTTAGLIDASGASASQIKFGNANNSANTATLDGYTDWISYTPTYTGFGTVSANNAWSKRIGDTLYIKGKFTCGTSTATEARITLGFNGTNANVTSDTTKLPSIEVSGVMIRGTATATAFYTLIEPTVGYITFGFQTAGSAGLTKQQGSALCSSTESLSYKAEIPISGW